MLFDHVHHGFGGHGWAWGFFGILPLILWGVLIGVGVWVVLRLTSSPRPAASPATALPPRPDGALQEVRLRYARGEISREEFVQRSRDLGGTELEATTPGPPETG